MGVKVITAYTAVFIMYQQYLWLRHASNMSTSKEGIGSQCFYFTHYSLHKCKLVYIHCIHTHTHTHILMCAHTHAYVCTHTSYIHTPYTHTHTHTEVDIHQKTVVLKEKLHVLQGFSRDSFNYQHTVVWINHSHFTANILKC